MNESDPAQPLVHARREGAVLTPAPRRDEVGAAPGPALVEAAAPALRGDQVPAAAAARASPGGGAKPGAAAR
jgi:hypothetical protein